MTKLETWCQILGCSTLETPGILDVALALHAALPGGCGDELGEQKCRQYHDALVFRLQQWDKSLAGAEVFDGAVREVVSAAVMEFTKAYGAKS